MPSTCPKCSHAHSVTVPCLEARTATIHRLRTTLVELGVEAETPAPHLRTTVRRLVRDALGVAPAADAADRAEHAGARIGALLPLLVGSVRERKSTLALRLIDQMVRQLRSLTEDLGVDFAEVLPHTTCSLCDRPCVDVRTVGSAGIALCPICLAPEEDLERRIKERHAEVDFMLSERRVRAKAKIIYGIDGPEIDAGTEGDVIKAIGGGQVLRIRWDRVAKPNGLIARDMFARIVASGIDTLGEAVELIEDADLTARVLRCEDAGDGTCIHDHQQSETPCSLPGGYQPRAHAKEAGHAVS